MSDAKSEVTKTIAEQLEDARVKLRATGATVLSPTAEWTALQKEIVTLKRKLRQSG
jgi:hypothetical protein